MNTWQEKFTNITWDTLREGTFELSKQIETNTLKPDLIVAIARGGLTIAQLLSDSLSLPIATFTVVSYKDLKQSHQPTITHPLGSPLDGKKVLLVDDISDTGITFKRGISYLMEQGVAEKNIITTALIHKPHSIFTPTYYYRETAHWVIMPYEVHETIKQLMPLWKKEGVTIEEMKKRFLSIEFNKSEINHFIIQYSLRPRSGRA
ncbi:MAG: phosphoribosyltransferase family protein [Patescibacteria group bacterium]